MKAYKKLAIGIGFILPAIFVYQYTTGKNDDASYGVVERMGLFMAASDHAPVTFEMGRDCDECPMILTFKYAYDKALLEAKEDSIITSLLLEAALLTDFVIGDSARYINLKYVDYCLQESGKEMSDKCFDGRRFNVNYKYMDSMSSDYDKALIFMEATKDNIQVDTSTDILKFTIRSNRESSFKIKEFSQWYTKRYARLLYVYIIQKSKRYNGAGFSIINTDEKGVVKQFDYDYYRGDKIFRELKHYINDAAHMNE